MQTAVKLLNEMGTEAVYTIKADKSTYDIKVLSRELGVEELVGDYRQGDMRFEIDADAIPGKPKKYDTVTMDGVTYQVKDPEGSPRRVGDVIYTYKFVARGQ